MAYTKKSKEEKKTNELIKHEDLCIDLGSELAITEVDIRPIMKGNLAASVTVTINDCLVIRDCIITTAKDKIFFNFPQGNYTGNDGKAVYYDKIFPTVKGVRGIIADAVIDLYKKS